jgi:hypothetical protein
MENFKIAPETEENLEMIANIFRAKKVPLEFITDLRNNKGIHEENWVDVKTTLAASTDPEDFEYYFEYVISKFEKLTFP